MSDTRQAVVVIHGIGEQRPMDTLRRFVEAIMPDPPGGKPKFWSKPDPMSELFELRRLTTPQTRSIPPTDFYEYYWAFHAHGTRFMHVWAWARSLLFRRPTNVPKHLQPLWFTLWTLIVATLVFLATAAGARMLGSWNQFVTASYIVSGISTLVLGTISGFIINYLGDAARYLNPKPANIDMRRRIRADGVALLRKLHESGEYDRIVVVGHSLGSVIAYDVLRHLWPRYNTAHGEPATIHQTEIYALDTIAPLIAAKSTAERLQEFRNKQVAVWREQRGLGNPWLITDLVTLGCPLAHAALLLAETDAELRDRQEERELPTCPPILDDDSASYDFTYETRTGAKRTQRVLHHGAVFGETRWTNIYFAAWMGFFGDLVGGPLRGVFGFGIKDVAVSSAEWKGLLQHTPISHTHYWNVRTVSAAGSNATPWALDAVRDSLGLESRALVKGITRERAAYGTSD